MTKNSKKGFTLVELILVIMITMVLTASALSGFISSQKTFIFNSTSQEVTSLIREARSFAVTGKAQIDYADYDNDGCFDDVITSHTGSTCVAGEPDYVTPANYGVHFDVASNTVTLFADLHNSTTIGGYDDWGGGLYKYSATKDIKISQYTIPDNYLFVLDPGGVNTMMYSPIFADVSFNNSVSDFFIFGVGEDPAESGTRIGCSAVHHLSGIPELPGKTGTSALCDLP